MAAAKYNPTPRSTSYEFGGPIGALGITLAVPFFSYWLTLACSPKQCPPWPLANFLDFHRSGWQSMLHNENWWKSFWSWEATGVYAAWYVWCIVCWAVLPGKEVEGVVMRDGKRLKYKMNAFFTMMLSLFLIGIVTWKKGAQPLLYIFDHYVELISAATAMSFLQATLVYLMSYDLALGLSREQSMLAEGGNTSNPLYNWFIGRGLNPRIGSFDIKSFNEMRPGLILWVIVDLAMAAKQFNSLGRVTDSMILTVLFHFWYVFDAEFNEEAILTTMDITTDGFGFMLAAGDLLWVPFTYSTSARFLAINPNDLGALGTAAILGVQFLGYYIFRTSNNEKNEFRKGKNPKNLKFLETERGTKLLTSGWWGASRHPNYMGDWLMSWAWCLPAGFGSPLPYFYMIYFGILLVHRQIRDDEACEHKYKKDWAKYKKLVPWRIIPYVY